VPAHVRAVMARIDAAPPGAAAPVMRRRAWLLAAIPAAAGVLLLVHASARRTPGADGLQARGGGAEPSLARDVGVWPCAYQETLRRLDAGAGLTAATPVTAVYRNIGPAPAFLLLFAIDTRGVVHWISPPYAHAEDDPAATPAATVGAAERPLASMAVLDGVAAGPLRIVAVIAPAPLHVSDVEKLAGADLAPDRLARRLAGADVRETVVTVQEVAP
jgi:hypothetical protein